MRGARVHGGGGGVHGGGGGGGVHKEGEGYLREVTE